MSGIVGSPSNGQASIGTTASQLTTTSKRLNRGLNVKALAANTDKVYVGGQGVTASGATGGYELSAGQAVPVSAADQNQVYAISASGTQVVCFVDA